MYIFDIVLLMCARNCDGNRRIVLNKRNIRRGQPSQPIHFELTPRAPPRSPMREPPQRSMTICTRLSTMNTFWFYDPPNGQIDALRY